MHEVGSSFMIHGGFFILALSATAWVGANNHSWGGVNPLKPVLSFLGDQQQAMGYEQQQPSVVCSQLNQRNEGLANVILKQPTRHVPLTGML